MIWRKSWWECRFRALLGAMMAVIYVLLWWASPTASWVLYNLMLAGLVMPVLTMLMAGSGINSQTSWGMLQGFHPSMYFFLSLPVSRRRALFVRSALGCAMTLLFVLLIVFSTAVASTNGQNDPAGRVFASLASLVPATLAYYGVSTFLTTLFDEFWAGTIGLGLYGAILGASVSMLRVKAHELVQLPIPTLPAFAFLIAIGVAFMAAAIYVVEKKEY